MSRPGDADTLGKIAYEAHCAELARHRRIIGVPPWSELGEPERRAWEAGARAAADAALSWNDPPTR